MSGRDKVAYVGERRNLNLETLALTHLSDENADLAGGVQRILVLHVDLPVVEDGLGEGLATGALAEISVEAEGLVDGEVGLDVEQRSAGALLLSEDVTTTAGKDTVDTTHGLLGNLDLDQEDGLLEGGLSHESSSVQDAASSRNDLSTTTMDSISVESNIHDVEADTTHGLLTDGTLTGGPLETGDNGILDLVEVLDGLGLVNEQVGTVGVGAESPDLAGIGDIPLVVVGHVAGTGLEVVTGVDLAVLNVLAELLSHGLSSHVDTVVLVGRLGKSVLLALDGDGLTVLDDGVGDDKGNTSVVLLEILQANLEMELTSTSNDVLTRLVGHGQDAGVGLGQTLKTLNKLGEILGVLDLDGTLDDRGDGELHDLEVVGGLKGGESTGLEQELIDTDQTNDVTSGHIVDGLDLAAHHENGTLDSLDEKIILLAGGVVGALDADLEAGADGTGEDTTESVETTLIGSGHHLGNVKHEGTLRVAVTDTNGSLIIRGTLVEGLHAVPLGSDGGRKVEDHHLQKAVSGGEESTHDNLEELLALLLAVLSAELEVQLGEEVGNLVLLEVHDGREDLEDGVEDELAESTLKSLTLIVAVLGPLLGLGVEVVVSPETLHHLVAVDTELLSVAGGKLTDGESPAVKTGAESDGTLVGVDLEVAHGLVKVHGDDDVDGLNGTGERLVQVLLGDLELEKSTIDLVDDDNGLDALTESLTKDSLGLDAHTLDGVDDDESTIGNTESSSDFRGEINVTGRIDQVDQEILACCRLLAMRMRIGAGD